MTIKLYYIHGISRIDTPYFLGSSSSAIRAKQEEYFDSKVVSTVECSFYPPHYKNVIKFDKEDLDFNVNVNYLSLEFNGRVYYYFIDDVEYVSESIIRVYVTMDVIQTYLTDISIANGIIERKFINRWEYNSTTQKWEINRNYIRENVASGEFYYYSRTVYNSDMGQWLLWFSVTEAYHTSNITLTVNYDWSVPGINEYRSGYMLFATPLFAKDCSKPAGDKSYIDNSSSTSARQLTVTSAAATLYFSGIETIAKWCQQNTLADLFICPFNCVDGVTINGTSLSFTNTNSVPMRLAYDAPSALEYCDFIAPQPNEHDSYASIAESIKLKGNSVVETFNIQRNSNFNTNFNSSYITQLLDENYIRYTFGSAATFTTIPLFYLRRATVNNNYAFNPTDGTRLYWITDDKSDINNRDFYKTCVVDNNILRLDMKNNVWNNYAAANKGRWLAAGANTVLDIFTKGAYSSAKAKFAQQDMNSIVNNPNAYDKRYNLPTLKKKYKAQYQSASRQEDLSNIETKNSVADASRNVLSQFMQDMNYISVPPTPKQLGSVSEIASNGAYIMATQERVNDYEQCAQYYHRNGFLVNQYISHTDTIFQDVNNRYYFNILKMALPEVHLNNVIEDDTTIDEIKERLIDGVRLWTVEHRDNIGDFSLDNTENMYD